MPEELNIITQLAIILVAAGIFTVISKALKQPLILGYIVAGFIVGPHLGLFPQFSPESVDEWAELGIIFLLFGLGLEFNFKKLLNVGSAALISAGTICIGMFVLGYFTGSALAWSNMESIFLGGMLSMSSTTIIIKAYDDLGYKNKSFATLVFGLLVVEDLLAVLMMVLFSTLAVSNQFSGKDMLVSLVKLMSFLVICFVIGIYVLPTALKSAKRYLSDEILLLISIGLCFLMVILANLAGFSSALGAFLMGSILSSTVEGIHIENITTNIKNLFGAIFFVSVGMMVDPAVIGNYWPTILAITAVVITGILSFSTIGALLAGKDLDTALHVGFSLPQLGEFSFIIAGLGCSLGVLRDFIYPVIISVSVITTFTTPYMIKAADPVSEWLHERLPANIIDLLNKRSQSEGKQSIAEENNWKEFLKKYFLRLMINGMLAIFILLICKEYLPKLGARLFPYWPNWLLSVFHIVITLAAISPFLYGLAVNGKELRLLGARLTEKDELNKIPLIVLVIFRILVAVIIAISAVQVFTNIPGWLSALLFFALIVLYSYERIKNKSFTYVEDRFFSNLNATEELKKKKAPVTTMINSCLEGRNIHIESVTISPDFQLAGRTLREMPFRHTTGVNIIKIQRGSRTILIPSGGEVIMPGDTLLAVGTNEQLKAFLNIIQANTVLFESNNIDFAVAKITLTDDSDLIGKKLMDTDMKESGCMVINIERNGMVHANPPKEFTFEVGDIVWLAGLRDSVNWYQK